MDQFDKIYNEIADILEREKLNLPIAMSILSFMMVRINEDNGYEFDDIMEFWHKFEKERINAE